MFNGARRESCRAALGELMEGMKAERGSGILGDKIQEMEWSE